jgi:two-component system sensor histidine kinase RegB
VRFATSFVAAKPAAAPALPEPGCAAVVPDRVSIERSDLQTLWLIRSVAIAAQTLALAFVSVLPEEPLPLITLAIVSLLFVVASLLALERIRRKTAVSDSAFFRQLLFDILVLTYLLCLSGGPGNPLHNMYVLPVTAAAALLPAAYVWRTAAAVVACNLFLEFVHVPLPADRPIVNALVRFGELFDHVLLATLVGYFVMRMSNGLRQRDRQLAEAHEREICAGCAIALGSVAAGAAHELATPLSTISTVLGELRADPLRQPELTRDIAILQASLSACLQCLRNLRAAGDAWIGGGDVVAADRFVEEVTKRFGDLRPASHVNYVFESPRPGPAIVPDLALQQAIINLLSNAAFVSPHDVTLCASWNSYELTVRVADRGPGISPEVAAQLGRVFITTKAPESGHGIGLFLTNVTVNRLNGRLRLFNAVGGGAIAEIAIPLASLQRGASE